MTPSISPDSAPAGGAYTLYLAVLPAYRRNTISILTETLGDSISIFVSKAHLDRTVTTGIDRSHYTEVRIIRLGSRLFLQTGHWRDAMRAQTLVVDLNPRSITAWLLLIARKLQKRRTLTWGHVSPQSGATSRSAGIRRTMRRLSRGTITYTYADQRKATAELPSLPTWVAPNAMYRQESMVPVDSAADRNLILYVGRFEPAKKVDLLVRAFALAQKKQPNLRLTLIGDGSEASALHGLVAQLNVAPFVEFPGWVSNPDALRTYYGQAICASSPGFAGLGLTQSLGFGVPCVIARSEPHSPEIELAHSTNFVSWFNSDDPQDMARALGDMYAQRGLVPNLEVARQVSSTYSAEAMAEGLRMALLNTKGD